MLNFMRFSFKTPLKMSTYSDIQVTYMLPVIAVLAFITRPFISRSEMFKMTVLSGLALIYTIPWFYFVIQNGALTYSTEKVLATVRLVPIEDCVFVVAHTVMTSLWTLLCTWWSIHPCLNFNHDKTSHQLIRWIPISTLSFLTVKGYRMMTIPGLNTFYLGSILCWACPAIILLWYGTGNYFVKRFKSYLIAIAAPTLFMCRVSQIVMNNNIRHVNAQTSLNAFVAEHLPIEDALFFLVSNVIIVLAVSSFDKARGLMETYSLEFPERFSISRKFIGQLIKAIATSECSMPANVTDDIKILFKELSAVSHTVYTGFLVSKGGKLI